MRYGPCMTTTSESEPVLENLTVRIRSDLRPRMDALAEAVTDRDDRDTRRSDIVRMALNRGLRELEAEYGVTP